MVIIQNYTMIDRFGSQVAAHNAQLHTHYHYYFFPFSSKKNKINFTQLQRCYLVFHSSAMNDSTKSTKKKTLTFIYQFGFVSFYFPGDWNHLYVVGIAGYSYIDALVFVRRCNRIHCHTPMGCRLLFGHS